VSAVPQSARARPADAGRWRALLDFYVTQMRTSIQSDVQYRTATYLYMLGMIAEPVVYLVVWTTIADAQGGAVDGITSGQFAAYYIVWTLVRNMNIVFTPYGWEWRIREGQLTGQLLRPMNVLHYDIAWFAGAKVVWIVLWLPLAAVLVVAFEPTLDPSVLQVAVFAVAIWGAYLIRTMFMEALGLLSFWTTRVGAAFELYFVFELLLSGRLVPLQLMPGWVQTLAGWLPFKWTFFFPIEALVGDLSSEELLRGLGMQVFWTLAGLGIFALVWRRAVRCYSAVGN
jgi:ABC-2 type transport system permease protein